MAMTDSGQIYKKRARKKDITERERGAGGEAQQVKFLLSHIIALV